MWKPDRQQHRQLRLLPAHRGRDRRQGLHLRPPQRRRRRAGDRPGARRLRVPGPEVLRRQPRLHPGEPLEGGASSKLLDEIATIKMGDVTDFRNFMGAVIDKARLRDASRATSTARAARRQGQGQDHRRRQVRRQQGLLHRAHGHPGQRPALRDHGRGDLRPGADDLRLRGEGPAEDAAPVRQVARPTP